MSQTLVIQKKYYDSLTTNIKILKEKKFSSADDFMLKMIAKLNDEFSYLEIDGYRFQDNDEMKSFSQYSAFVDGDTIPYNRVFIFLTPINSKMGDVIVEQSVMPTICKQMNLVINFLLDERYKKIVLLTSKINTTNEVDVSYNTIQMNVNSLNTLGFDIIQFIPIKNLATDTKFNSLTEYLDMSNYLQKKAKSNAQVKYLKNVQGTLYGYCKAQQWKGQFPKSFCFRFLTAMFAGGNDYKYDISAVLSVLTKRDNQISNLEKFVSYFNNEAIQQTHMVVPTDEDIVECDDEIVDIQNLHRKPEKGIDNKGRKRYKTQKKVKDTVLKKANYLCDCDDKQHFYFESVELHRYVEGHHIVPMNRQEEYYFDKNINLDVPNNIIPLCPTCHCQIHLGSRQSRIKILSELFVRNKAKLLVLNPDLTLSILASYYNIGLEEEEEHEWLRHAEKIVSDKNNVHN